MPTRRFLLTGTAIGLLCGFIPLPILAATETFEVTHSDAEWRQLLTPEQYAVLRRDGTERPGSSPLLNEHRAGVFTCAGCARDLFSSATKFDSHTGWPSFWAPLDGAVGETKDTSLFMVRTAVHCSRCGGHLGHVFNDGPKPTGLRYCMNGVAMNFQPSTA
jgi:peptide-methionine (R)-S-oxide reductase